MDEFYALSFFTTSSVKAIHGEEEAIVRSLSSCVGNKIDESLHYYP